MRSRAAARPVAAVLVGAIALALASPTHARIRSDVAEAVEKALDHLARTQKQDGSWPDHYGNSPGVVGLCLLAFLAHGEQPGRGKYKDAIDRAIDYILSNAQESGLISRRGSQPMYNHGFATLALAEVYGMTKRRDVERALLKAVELIVRCQNYRGGWRYQARAADDDITVTGCQLMALRAARNAGVHVPASVIDKGIKYLESCAHPSGGFGYQPGQHPGKARTGIGVSLLCLLGKEESQPVLKGSEYLLNNGPRYRETYFYYGIYYCSQAMYQVGGKYWQFWEKEMTDTLLATQNPDGSWPREGSAGGPAYATAMAVLALEINWKFLPIYQR